MSPARAQRLPPKHSRLALEAEAGVGAGAGAEAGEGAEVQDVDAVEGEGGEEVRAGKEPFSEEAAGACTAAAPGCPRCSMATLVTTP